MIETDEYRYFYFLDNLDQFIMTRDDDTLTRTDQGLPILVMTRTGAERLIEELLEAIGD